MAIASIKDYKRAESFRARAAYLEVRYSNNKMLNVIAAYKRMAERLERPSS